jgi:hypothetical protein
VEDLVLHILYLHYQIHQVLVDLVVGEVLQTKVQILQILEKLVDLQPNHHNHNLPDLCNMEIPEVGVHIVLAAAVAVVPVLLVEILPNHMVQVDWVEMDDSIQTSQDH